MRRKQSAALQQFEYRVRMVQDCIVLVEAASQQEADEKAKSPENWLDEQSVDCVDWEIRGRA
jgi:hypothetical protein